METSKSAFTSNSVTSAMNASMTMGTPHSSTASHAGSIGSESDARKLASNATAEMSMNATSLRTPPFPSRFSSGSK